MPCVVNGGEHGLAQVAVNVKSATNVSLWCASPSATSLQLLPAGDYKSA